MVSVYTARARRIFWLNHAFTFNTRVWRYL
jgi:hypothetical protein